MSGGRGPYLRSMERNFSCGGVGSAFLLCCFIHHEIKRGSEQFGQLHFLGVRWHVQRSGRGVVQLRFANNDAVRAGFTKATFAFSGVNFGTFTVVVVDSVRLFSQGRIYHVRRVFVCHSAARMIRVHFHSAHAVGFQLRRFGRRGISSF